MRTIIDLPDEQIRALDAICGQEQISRAEAIRRAVATMIRSRPAAEGQAFGLWSSRAEDGVTYQQRLRREWDAPAARGRRR